MQPSVRRCVEAGIKCRYWDVGILQEFNKNLFHKLRKWVKRQISSKLSISRYYKNPFNNYYLQEFFTYILEIKSLNSRLHEKFTLISNNLLSNISRSKSSYYILIVFNVDRTYSR